MVQVLIGDLFASEAQTWVNTVNCVGVMGRGVALGFKQRFPEMFEDYAARCGRGEVRLGQPYLYRRDEAPWILNFPTKDHWRSVSKLDDIEQGLVYLAAHVKDWGITSLAVPPLGCGNGQLDWRVVGPVLHRRLREFDIPVELYAPHGTPAEQLRLGFLESGNGSSDPLRGKATGRAIPSGAMALVELLAKVQAERYRAPIGRTVFQKMAYFATERGVPTGLEFEQGSYGPFSCQMKRLTSLLINNGLIEEVPSGQRIEVRTGPAFESAHESFAEETSEWSGVVDELADLFLRMHGRQAEIAATVHFAACHLLGDEHLPTECEVFDTVRLWKERRKPPLDEKEVASAIRHLNVLGWIEAAYSPELPAEQEEHLV